ncbi:MAG: site-specific DNA-methyltransferase [Gemmatimonadales bacterium]|nr:site-specific DNA-methyltransferase [Gemmatimonadales bacterium]
MRAGRPPSSPPGATGRRHDSGTTLIAAERLDRRCHGMEIDPRYASIIIERWERFTGREAVRG